MFAVQPAGADAREALVGQSVAGPTLVKDVAVRLDGMPWSRYDELAKTLQESRFFVRLIEPLPGNPQDALYGLNAVLPSGDSHKVLNLSWVLFPDASSQLVLIVDVNGNGALSDDPRVRLSKSADGTFVAEQAITIVDPDGMFVLPVSWLVKIEKPGVMQLYRYPTRERRGTITIEGDRHVFALRTDLATFDGPAALLGIDLDRDGKIRFADGDPEIFRGAEEHLSIAGKEYAVSIERHGDSLTLVPTGRPGVPRYTLQVGSKAPVLPDGRPLASREGRPVLLSFWSPRCSASMRMAPRIAAAWERMRERVEFVGITNAAREEAARAIQSLGHPWPQWSGQDGEALFALYRISAVPTYVLIGPDGLIKARGSTQEWPEIEAAAAGIQANSGPIARECRALFRFTLVPGERATFVARRAWVGLPSREDRACSTSAASEWRSVEELLIANDCESGETAGGSAAPDKAAVLHEQAVARLTQWLADHPGPEGEDASSAMRRVTAVYDAFLDETSLCEWLAKATIKHVDGRSPCYLEAQQELQRDLEAARREVDCNDWSRFLSICTSDHPTVAAHIKYFPETVMTEAQRHAIESLLAEGLTECLANLIEDHGGTTLKDEIRSTTVTTAPDVMARTRAAAWKVWSSHGVAGWLNEASKGDAVPRPARDAIARCSKRLYPLVHREGDGGSSRE